MQWQWFIKRKGYQNILGLMPSYHVTPIDSNAPLVCFTTKYPSLKLSKISGSSIDRNFKSSEYKTRSNGIAVAKLP